MWYILKNGEDLLVAKKEHCMPLWKEVEYSYIYRKDDIIETTSPVDVNMIMITKNSVTISRIGGKKK